MNNKLIEKIDKALGYAKEYVEYLTEKGSECHKECGREYDYIIPDSSEEENRIEKLEYLKEILLRLNEENIDLDKKYFITDNVYLTFFLWDDVITFNFYIEDDIWIYNNYIDSHSGITEWLNAFINESYIFYMGFCDLNDYKRIIKNVDGKCTAKEAATDIKNLINFFTNDKKKIRNAIIDDIEYRFKKMHDLVENDEGKK